MPAAQLYSLEVRAEEPPHEVLGHLAVPYDAAIGRMPVVTFEARRSTADRVAFHRHLQVHEFAHGGTGARWFAFKVKRDEWPALRALIT